MCCSCCLAYSIRACRFEYQVLVLLACSKYVVPRQTFRYKVRYFVKRDFSTEYKGNIRQLELHIEDEYLADLRNNCYRERSYSECKIDPKFTLNWYTCVYTILILGNIISMSLYNT